MVGFWPGKDLHRTKLAAKWGIYLIRKNRPNVVAIADKKWVTKTKSNPHTHETVHSRSKSKKYTLLIFNEIFFIRSEFKKIISMQSTQQGTICKLTVNVMGEVLNTEL